MGLFSRSSSQNQDDAQDDTPSGSDGWHRTSASPGDRTADHAPRKGEDTSGHRRDNFGRTDGS